MIHNTSDTVLSQLTHRVATHLGLHFPPEHWKDLARGIGSAAQELGFKDPESCFQWLASTPPTRQEIEILSSHLTIGETYFFRERQSLSALEEQVLPDLLASRRTGEKRLRIWSAGCSTGEEPYSVAVMLSRSIPDLTDWNAFILATDINPRSLQSASGGRYSKWSFRDTLDSFQGRYFEERQDSRFEIIPSIKKMVTFSCLNLAEDVYPSLWNDTNAMDVIFCRNVLMYFSPERAKQVVQNLHRALVDGGWLIVGISEISQALFSEFVPVNFPGTVLYRKDGHRTSCASVPSFQLLDTSHAPQIPISVVEPLPELDAAHCLASPPAEAPEPNEAILSPYQEAVALYQGGNYSEATEKLAEFLSKEQGDVEVMALMARIYANQGQLTDGLLWCDRAIATDKLNATCHYLRATIVLEQGAMAEAFLSLKRTLYLDPEFVLAHFTVANLMLREKRMNESVKHFNSALSLLRGYGQQDILPGSEGLTAGRLAEIIRSTAPSESLP